METVRIGVVGDFNPEFESHTTTDSSLRHAGDHLGVRLEFEWVPTPTLAGGEAAERLEPFDGLWISAGSPYRAREGAFAAVRFAREHDRPMLATCGGFQHALLEHARHVLGIADAEHAEDAPEATNFLIIPVACPVPRHASGAPKLSGGLRIRLAPGSRIHALYGADAIEEEYFCNFEVNPAFRERIERSDLRVTGVGNDDEIRAVELPSHRFYLATLFQPQRSSRAGAPNPAVTGFVSAARVFGGERSAVS